MPRFMMRSFEPFDDSGAAPTPSDVSRWEADHVAIIVAETAAAAHAGAAALEIEWEDLPIVADIDEALATDAPIIHPDSKFARSEPTEGAVLYSASALPDTYAPRSDRSVNRVAIY